MNIGAVTMSFGLEIKDKISCNIYFSGCKNNKNCDIKECHNPQLRLFNYGYSSKSFEPLIQDQGKNYLVECFCLMGGEPFDQNPDELLELIEKLKKYKLPIYTYTGYDLNDIPEDIITKICPHIDLVCIGEYNPIDNKKIWIKI